MLPESAENIVKAVVVLHNFLKKHGEQQYTPPGFTDTIDTVGNLVQGEWRTLTDPLQSVPADSISRGHNASRNAFQIRNILAQYVLDNPRYGLNG